MIIRGDYIFQVENICLCTKDISNFPGQSFIADICMSAAYSWGHLDGLDQKESNCNSDSTPETLGLKL